MGVKLVKIKVQKYHVLTLSMFFSEIGTGKYIPHSIYVDLESSIIGNAKASLPFWDNDHR